MSFFHQSVMKLCRKMRPLLGINFVKYDSDMINGLVGKRNLNLI
jgi:hypothetical protein